MSKLEEQQVEVQRLSGQLAQSEWVSAQLSKGVAVAMRALGTHQVARRVLRGKLEDARAANSEISKQLMQAGRQCRVLEGKVSEEHVARPSPGSAGSARISTDPHTLTRCRSRRSSSTWPTSPTSTTRPRATP